jgi:hypothetical protein
MNKPATFGDVAMLATLILAGQAAYAGDRASLWYWVAFSIIIFTLTKLL